MKELKEEGEGCNTSSKVSRRGEPVRSRTSGLVSVTEGSKYFKSIVPTR